MEKSQKSEIQRYYTRTRQGSHGNDYYVEPSQACPLDVLNTRNRFVLVTFDKADDYIVVNHQRYYLNKHTAIKCTDKRDCRVAIVDLVALKQSKAYPYNPKYRHQHTLEVDNFDNLEAEARRQYSFNGLPYVRQKALYDPTSNSCSYAYEPSFQD